MGVAEEITDWIREQTGEAGARGAVFGLSGGLDSSVVGALCKNALGESVLGVLLPCHGDPREADDAVLVADRFEIPTVSVDLGGVLDALLGLLPEGRGLAAANLRPRLRMAVLYYFANDRGYLVVGTGNKSEISVGYFTKFGDGAADILPLAQIYKTDLAPIARELGVPPGIIEKPPSAGLWEGQTDEGEMGITYRELDSVLKALEEGRNPEAPVEVVERVLAMMRASEHKRQTPPRFFPRRGGPE
ncbi:MAG: NAD(+) synthase [Actinobacteria bacterium]|nr:NAD(+) synthase [Actinomycetota bacterium]